MMLKIIFEEYKIDNKIFSIGFDNASNNIAVIAKLIVLCNPYFGGQFFHQKCACHILNLWSKWISVTIMPIRIAFHYLWKHQQVMKNE